MYIFVFGNQQSPFPISIRMSRIHQLYLVYKNKSLFISKILMIYIGLRLGLWCLMPLSIIFEFYRGGQL